MFLKVVDTIVTSEKVNATEKNSVKDDNNNEENKSDHDRGLTNEAVRVPLSEANE